MGGLSFAWASPGMWRKVVTCMNAGAKRVFSAMLSAHVSSLNRCGYCAG